MERKNLDFEEKFLLLLYFSKDNNTLITRAMKLMFLFEKIFEIKTENELEFIAYDLGPFAKDFQIYITPLITEELVAYREFCDSNLNYISESYYKKYFFNEKRKGEIKTILENEYLYNKYYKNPIKLIKFLTEFYNQAHSRDLIQLCYFIEPEFAQNSVIDEEVEYYNRSYNQKFILKAVLFLSENHLLKLFRNLEGVLKIFNIRGDNIEKENFRLFLEEHLNAVRNKSGININKAIEIIDNISIRDQNKTYKFLKFKLLEIYSLINEEEINLGTIRLLLHYFFKSLTLQWALNENNMKKFRNIIKELKKKIQLISIKDDQPPLSIDYSLLKKELENDFQKKTIKKIKDRNEVGIQKEELEYKGDFLIDKKNFPNIFEEFSEEELEELNPSEDNKDLVGTSSEI